MKELQKMYNLYALILKMILDKSSERNFESLRNIEKEYEDQLIEQLRTAIPDLFDKQSLRFSNKASEYDLRRNSLTEDIKSYILDYDKRNLEELVYLVKYMDLVLEDSFYDFIPIEEDLYFFQSLNNNVEECQIYLLPRVQCNWEHKSREEYISYNILYYMRNFYYVQVSDLHDYNLENILLNENIFRDEISSGEFRIMISPVTNEHMVNPSQSYVRNHTNYFSVEPISSKQEEKLSDLILKILNKAACSETNILVFPEMLGTDKIISRIKNELYSRNNIPMNAFPQITICPTVWKNQNNTCYVLDDSGDEIMRQQKHFGMDLKNDKMSSKEDIISDHKIYILHCQGVGRIAVVICKDFLVNGYLKILVETLKINFIMVPSFSKNDYLFKIKLSKYGDQDCSVIWVNTCSAKEDKEIAISMAYMSSKTGNNLIENDTKELCKGLYNCDDGCYYIYEFNCY